MMDALQRIKEDSMDLKISESVISEEPAVYYYIYKGTFKCKIGVHCVRKFRDSTLDSFENDTYQNRLYTGSGVVNLDQKTVWFVGERTEETDKLAREALSSAIQHRIDVIKKDADLNIKKNIDLMESLKSAEIVQCD